MREDDVKFRAELKDGREIVRVFANDFLDVSEVGLDLIGSRLVNFLCKMQDGLLFINRLTRSELRAIKLVKSRCNICS